MSLKIYIIQSMGPYGTTKGRWIGVFRTNLNMKNGSFYENS